MLTLKINYEILPDRLITIKLPETVHLGQHEMLIVMEEKNTPKNSTNANSVMQLAGSITAFHAVDGIEYQNKVRSEWN